MEGEQEPGAEPRSLRVEVVPEPKADSEEIGYDETEAHFEEATGMPSEEGSQPMEELEEEEKEDEISRIGDSSDDPCQKRSYLEYLSLIKEISCQNMMIEDIKTQIMELCSKPCKTKCEFKDIKRLRTCMETENLKLRCMLNKAMQLQNFGSHRRYPDIPIATTIDEENLTPYVGCIPPQITNWKGPESSEAEKSSCQDSNSMPDKNQQIKCLCQAMGRMKICCPEDKKLVKEIAAALLCSSKKQQPDPCGKQDPCGGGRDPCGRGRDPCGGGRDPCGGARDPCGEARGPCGGSRPKQSVRKSKSHHVPDCHRQQMSSSVGSLDQLKQKIICMQASVNKLKQEICKREHKDDSYRDVHRDREMNVPRPCPCADSGRDQDEGPDPILACTSKRNTKADQLEKLKENYLYLLSEFAKKDCQLKELEKRFKGVCGSCGSGNGKPDKMSADESELILLRARVGEMKEEQVEFKCLMKEQAQQLEDYRNKYLAAQQKVEEQNVTLEKLNLNNKRIEKQINTEVKEIRAKFQEKLNELLHFPKLLENEQIKLATVCKEKEDLNAKLALVCKELKSVKAQLQGPKDQDCRPQLMKCQQELGAAQAKIEELERQRDMFCEQLKTTQEDLDTLRTESANIIARTKERAEMTKQQQQEQIDRLEKELAQCRATACLSVSDREAVIREMQGQLNTLSYSFDAAQKQIKTLRNHVAYVSNENCFPIKC